MNTKQIKNPSANSLYMVHSSKKEMMIEEAAKNKEKQTKKLEITDLYVHSSKNYHYDSNGGGYQGL